MLAIQKPLHSASRAVSKAVLAAMIICILAFAHGVYAQTAQPQAPEVLRSLITKGAELRYLGRDQGLDGWVTIINGQEQYFYVSPDGQAILSGILYNRQGEVVTRRQVEQLRQRAGLSPAATSTAAKATASKGEQLLQAVESSNWFPLGNNGAPPVYSFIDPQCQHCHEFLKQIRDAKLVEDGKLQLRLVPVGIINKDSVQQAAALLEDADAGRKLYEAIDGNPAAIPSVEGINTQAVQQNLSIMQAWKMTATPFTVYRARDGQVKIIRGTPNDIKSLVDQLP